MAQYVTCEYCGSNLDPGEKCDCRKEKSAPSPPARPKKEYIVHSISPEQGIVNKNGGKRYGH